MNRRDAIKGIVAVGAGLIGVTAIAEPNDGFVFKETWKVKDKIWQVFSKTAFRKSDAKDEKNRIVLLDSRTFEPFVCDCTVRVEEKYAIIDGKKHMLPTVIAKGQTVEGYYMERINDYRGHTPPEPIRTTLVI